MATRKRVSKKVVKRPKRRRTTKEKSFESEEEARKFYNTIDENQRSFDDIFADFIETDDSTEIKAYIKSKGKEAISKIKSELPKTPDRIRKALAKLLKIELDEARSKENIIGKKVKLTNTNDSKEYFGTIEKDLGNGDFIYKDEKSGKLEKSTGYGENWKIEIIDEVRTNKTSFDYKSTFTKKDAPKLESLISKIMNETLAKKSAR